MTAELGSELANQTNAIQGFVAPGYEGVAAEFGKLRANRPGWSGAVAAYAGGQCVVDLEGGPGATPDRLQAVYSCGKGAAAVALLRLVQRGELELDAALATYWPEFARYGKGKISVGDALAHRAGVPDVSLTFQQLVAHEPAAELVAAARPAWEPGKHHGYHALTIGVIADELVRRTSNQTLGELYEKEVARPAGIELHFGTPAASRERVGIARSDPDREALPAQAHTEMQEALMERAMADLPAIEQLPESPDFYSGAVLAVNGVGSARGLARLYGACVATIDGVRLLNEATVKRAVSIRSDGWDLVLPLKTTFGVLFQLAGTGAMPDGTFGHDGAAGSVGLGALSSRVGFGFVSDHRPPPLGADPAAFRLYKAVEAAANQAA